MGPTQHKQFHCRIAIYFINYEVPIIKLEYPALELVESMQATPVQAAMQRAVAAPAPAPASAPASAPAEQFE